MTQTLVPRERTWSGALARMAESLTTPLLPAEVVDMVAPLHGTTLRGRIEGTRAETDRAATLLIRTGRGWAGHIPGQYVRVGVDVDGVRLWRAYSITSGPRGDGRIAITVKALPDGRVSNHMVGAIRRGAIIQLDQATGEFQLPHPLPERALFVTAGSGITPVMGILRHHLDDLSDVVVLHSDRNRDDVIFGGELRAWAAAGRLRLIERHTDREGPLDADGLARSVPDWQGRRAFACGPVGLLDTLEEHWADAGLGAALHTERFRAVVRVEGAGGQVTFTRTGTTVDADGATPLLDEGEAAGVLMPSGCRMGICYGCVLPLTSGAVRDLRTGALTTAEPGDGVKVQTCITAAAGPCVLEV